MQHLRTVMRLRRRNSSVGFDLLITASVADLKSDIGEKACFKEIEAGLGGLMVRTFVVVFAKGQLPTDNYTHPINRKRNESNKEN